MKTCVLDFETASAADLKKAGGWRYAEDATTEILCLAFVAGTDIFVWTPSMDWQMGDHTAQRLMALVVDPLVTFIAHNAAFEKAIWRNIMAPQFGFPDIPDHRWHDTMASCAMKVIPQNLERAAKVLGLQQEKDAVGSRLTISLSKPNKKTGAYDRSPETLQRVYDYCAQDVRAEVELHNRIGWLPRGERRVWLLDQKINERGVKLDLDYIHKAQQVVDLATVPLAAEFKELTGGLAFTQAAKIVEWVRGQGVALPNMQKATLARILGGDVDQGEDDDDEDFGAIEDDSEPGGPLLELPGGVRRALSIRQLIGSASVKKLGRMAAAACGDGRARGLLQYHGAGPGRWAGRIIQPQNFPRGTIKQGDKPVPIDVVIDAIMTGDPEWVEALVGPAVETVVGGLRHAIVAEKDHGLLSGDFAQVECRVLLALAGQHDKVDLMAAGHSPYPDMGEKIYGWRPDKHKDVLEYTLAKNVVLGCGFQMGAQKFMDRYGQGQSLPFFKEVIRVYREEWAPEVPKLWYALERAAIRTVWEKTPHEAYGVLYALEDGWLTARLPSGRKLWYFNPQPVRRAMPWDETDVRQAFTYQAQKMGRWVTVDAYGGLLTENVVQGLARDLLVEAMLRAEANGLPIVLTVHDEILAEPHKTLMDERLLTELMTESSDWAKGLRIPVAVDTWAGDRYRK
jgi:DNA polymerase bacteriophage-type